MKDRDNITKTLLNKIPEIVIYLEKYENFEGHLKNTIIPILIQFLNFNQLDVSEKICRLKKKQGINLEN